MQDENYYNFDTIKCLTAGHIGEKMYPSVEESLKRIILKEGYSSCKIFKRLLSTEGGNYLGDLYEINIKGEAANGIKETNIFLKQAIKMASTKNVISVHSIYQNELFIYTELNEVINNLQDEAAISHSERFKMVKSYDESNIDAIILENLTKKGFATGFRMDVVNLNFAVTSVKQLAKFHSLSFVMKHKKNDYYNELVKKPQIAIIFNDALINLIKSISDDIVKFFDPDIQSRLKNFSATICEKLPKYFEGETGTVSCLCHGDFRINNILFKENDLEPAEAVIIDYQMIFWGSPVFDLLYFFYTCTDRQFRKDNMNYLKDIYHDTMRDYLRHFNVDVDEIYPKKIFLEDFEVQLEVGLMVAFYALPFCFTREDALPDFKDDITEMKINLHDGFTDRFREIVEDYLEYGII